MDKTRHLIAQKGLSAKDVPRGERRDYNSPRCATVSRQHAESANNRGACRRETRLPVREEAMAIAFTVNGKAVSVEVAPNTPLLWALREHLKLTGTKYGCGIAACGACTVHVEGKAIRSCQMPLSEVQGKKVTTIEGLSPDRSHALQKAWIAEQVPQCGYCQSGQIMQAAELLATNRKPTREQIVAHMDGNICRCGTYPRIVRAIERAAREA
jgi:isoquinoline 1-oxidoreductase alpha subunit